MIMEAVNTESLWNSVIEFYQYATHVSVDQEQQDSASDTGFLYISLLLRCSDLGLALNKEMNKHPAWIHFMRGTMSVEILKKDQLQRLYFRVHDQSVLRTSVQDRLKWEVDRSSHGNKMRDFMAWIKDIQDDIQYQRRNHQNLWSRFLVKRWKFLNYTSLMTTMILNMVLIVVWRIDYRRHDWLYHPKEMDTVWRICGVLHSLCAFFLVASYFLSNLSGFASSKRTYIRNFKRFRLLTKEKSSGDRPSKLEVNFIGVQNIYYIMFLIFSLIGTIKCPAFYAFHLLQIVANNQLLMRVIRAVTLNGRSLLWVALMGLIIIYFYGLIGFMTLRNVFLGNLHFCNDVWQCTLTMLREGLIYRVMRVDYPVKLEADRIPDNADFDLYALKMLFDISFFIIVLTIGLNVIFGIIVDTFRQLRDDKWRVEQDAQSNCFICGRNSYEFEQRGISFLYHCNQEHSVLAYVFFFVRLGDIPIERLSHLEMYVTRQVKKENYNFFPLNRALSLDDEDENSDDENDEIWTKLDEILDKLNEESEKRKREEQKLLEAEWQNNQSELIIQAQPSFAASIEEIDVNYSDSASLPRPTRSADSLPFRPVSKNTLKR